MSKTTSFGRDASRGRRKARDPDEWGTGPVERERTTRDVRTQRIQEVRPSVAAMTDNSVRTLRKMQHREISPGEVHYVRIPYTDGEGDKARPAIVLQVDGAEVHVLPITSSAKGLEHASYVLQDAAAAGLSRRSGVRGSVVTIPLPEIQRGSYVGELASIDRDGLAFWLDIFKHSS